MPSDDRSVQSQANQNANNAGATGSNLNAQAGSIAGTLIPTLRSDITNPNGLTPSQQANMITAGAQAAGGAGGSVAGEAMLRAGRTNNTGSLSSVLDQAARRVAQQGSQNTLGVLNKSADIANQRRSAALGGLSGLYGTDVSGALKAMGLQNEDLDTELKAGQSGPLQNMILPTLSTLGGASKGPMAYV